MTLYAVVKIDTQKIDRKAVSNGTKMLVYRRKHWAFKRVKEYGIGYGVVALDLADGTLL